MKNKYKSGLSKYIYIALVVYHIMIILPFILVNFLKKDVVTWCGYVLFIIDLFYLLPLLFNTYYSLEDTYLFVNQWPLTRLQIYYNDIFIIDNELPADADKKHIKRFNLSKKFIVIGYYGEELDRKEKRVKKVKKYITISPADADNFLIKIGGNFSSAKNVAEKIEKAMKENEEKLKIKKEKEKEKLKNNEAEKRKNDIVASSKKASKFRVEESKPSETESDK